MPYSQMVGVCKVKIQAGMRQYLQDGLGLFKERAYISSALLVALKLCFTACEIPQSSVNLLGEKRWENSVDLARPAVHQKSG